MRFAVVDTTLTTPPTGGCQTFLEHLAPALKSRGHKVDVLTQPGPELAVADRLEKAGVRVLDAVWPRRFLPEERASCLADWSRRERIEAYIVSVSSDVGWLALPLLDRIVRTGAIVHADSLTFYAPLAYYEPFVDHAIGVSREACRNITRLCGIPARRALHIPYGVERLSDAQFAERLRASPGRRALEAAYVGRLVHSQKRILDLAPVVIELTRRHLPFRMHIIGSGEDAHRLRADLAAARVDHQVRWWGWLAPADVRLRLSQLDVIVLLSDTEGLPLVLLEAMGHGVVPVATRIPSGNTELVRDGENGYLAEVGDTKAFADRLEKLHREPRLLARLRRAAWLTSADYSVERMATSYEVCFTADAARASRPAGAFPVMPSCRSRYPAWLRKVKWRLSSAMPRARAISRRRDRA
jgi:glycosyltransferase involved in cell wall biosynthesis